MHSKVKKIIVFALVLTMLMPLGTVFADNDNPDDIDNGSADTNENGDTAEEEEEEEEEVDASSDIIDLAVETTVDYVVANMSRISGQGKYTIYKGIVKEKKNLQNLIEGAVYYTAESYTKESFANFTEKLEKATAVEKNITSTQRELDEATIALDRATTALVLVDTVETPIEEPETVDKTNLQSAIDGISPDFIQADYTEYTWEIYTNAIESAKEINVKADAKQSEVDAAIAELSYTTGKLVNAPEEVIAVVSAEQKGPMLVATISKAEVQNGSAVNISKNGTWVVETDSNYSKVNKFYIRLLSHEIENAYVTTALNEVYFMDVTTGEVSDTFKYESSDNINGRLYKNTDGKMLFTTLETERLLAVCEEVTQNDKFILYADTQSSKVAMFDKAANKFWWSTPVNPYGDSTVIDEAKQTGMKLPQRNQAASGLILQYGDLKQEKRNETYVYSKVAAETGKVTETWKLSDKGITISYKFTDIGFTVPVHYTLFDDRVDVSVDISEIEEKDTNTVSGKVITSLAMAPTFGASPATDLAGNDVDGYMIVPDGSGAVINYNNGKEGYSSYSQTLYGRDITNVPLNAPRVTEQAYLPVIATVSGNTGLVAIATDGDANATVNAKVSKMDKQTFNSVYFEFKLRSSDTFFMGGTDGTKITVFEKGDIKTDKISVSYYPINDDESVNYADVAEVYRNYLINAKGLEKKAEANKTNLYLDLFGSVLKQTSIAGIPVDLKTEVTGFEQAEEILKLITDGGVGNVVVNYSDWTNKSINGNISTKFNPSGKLGGKTEMLDLIKNSAGNGIEIYPSLSNMKMNKSSWGYFTLNSTAIRVSNAQSRQSEFSTAFGVQMTGKAPALLTPNAYTKAFDQMISSYNDNSVENIGFGDYSNTLVTDFSKKNAKSRESTMNTIIDGYKDAASKLGGVLADEANSYVIPYANHITNIPVYSSQYNIVDYDIPLYQMVIHGYVPYSSTPINQNSNPEEVFLLSLASGSGIHYDMIYENAYELIDTDYSDLYYANYMSWVSTAVEQYKFANDVLGQVNDMIITDYQIDTSTGVIKTTYNDSIVITVDTTNSTVDVNGQSHDISKAIEGGLQG